ncbi:Six-hairpin glycosidase-like protein [Pterulicium gracile]|uniref:Six-hairpin glycosidase-like protein n=1 Tax=Pterulicium gracile TaxID=1884261 RepID=A0A5C3QEQ8_9AGAR|nr:Six-hairpin glycosidase-like protein [Pterula gracilis]
MSYIWKWLTVATSVAAVVAQDCPVYTEYSQEIHEPLSEGRLQLPYMRPDPACRTFNSTSVEKVIEDMRARLQDPDLARLFENTFPNTLDTTVKYFDPEQNLAFIITGDIDAQWLRDTANQFAHYHALLSIDPELATLVKAIINVEARYVAEYPYCNAFQPPVESGLEPTYNEWALNVRVNPPVNNETVFECKYEIDSLSGFVKLSRSYYEETGDDSFINDNWIAAIDQVFRVINEQSQASFDDDYNWVSYFNWTGTAGALSPRVFNHGNGEPKGYTGMVGTHHRPADDLSVFAYLVPANAMLSVELGHLHEMLNKTNKLPEIAEEARIWSERIEQAVWNVSVIDDVFAFESNGLGSHFFMDDANVPSLLSLPYLGFLDRNDTAYVKTRQRILSKQNPYYAEGETWNGVGGPHVDPWHPWPMSHVSAIFGTDDDEAILNSLYLLANNTEGLGLMHESVSIYGDKEVAGVSRPYTRPWFAWANSYFAEMLLDLAERKPHLIFNDSTPYRVGQD